MKEITVKKILYDFEEVREKALEKNRYMFVDDYSYWYQNVFWECEDELKDMGFMNPQIDFSGFCSQGDGACFDADINDENLFDYLQEKDKLTAEEVKKLKNISYLLKITIEKTNNSNLYCHEKTRYINVNDFYIENEDDKKLTQKLEKIVEEIRLEKSKEIYKRLEDEYDSLTSDECLTDLLNDAYWFNEDGTIYESK